MYPISCVIQVICKFSISKKLCCDIFKLLFVLPQLLCIYNSVSLCAMADWFLVLTEINLRAMIV